MRSKFSYFALSGSVSLILILFLYKYFWSSKHFEIKVQWSYTILALLQRAHGVLPSFVNQLVFLQCVNDVTKGNLVVILLIYFFHFFMFYFLCQVEFIRAFCKRLKWMLFAMILLVFKNIT